MIVSNSDIGFATLQMNKENLLIDDILFEKVMPTLRVIGGGR